MCLFTPCPSALSCRYRILYASTDHALVKVLRAGLEQLDCYVVYCPGDGPARTLIASNIRYALLILDDLPGATGVLLAQFARSVSHRVYTPLIIVPPREKPGGGAYLVERVKRLLAGDARAPDARDVL